MALRDTSLTESAGPVPPTAPALDAGDRARLLSGAHHDPHALLGAHPVPDGIAFRALRPFADAVSVVIDGERTPLTSEGEGLFSAVLPLDAVPEYSLVVVYGGDEHATHDPYRFLPALGELDLHLIREGRHEQLWKALGAEPMTHQGVSGTRFTVWAPNAQGVRVAADFTCWDGTAFPMRSLGASGVWELFLPGVGEGTKYKFEITSRYGERFLKADPMARRTEVPPDTASIVTASHYAWGDEEWLAHRGDTPVHEAPFSVYEVHLPSWRQGLTYRELAEQLPPYVKDLGFTHVELMPVAEHPFGGSWGYQVTGFYAPTSRLGTPDDFRYFVDSLHRAGIGVIMDWVPAPGRQRGVLVRGVPHRRAARGRGRLDAVPRLLARVRTVGGQQPRRPGGPGRDGVPARDERDRVPAGAGRGDDRGGVDRVGRGDPADRQRRCKYHHHEMTFSMVYAYSENYVLPISHDEVVHGKQALVSKMPGDWWQRRANHRAYLGFMWAHPGKQLLFMGQEFAQGGEWSEAHGPDWWLLDPAYSAEPDHRGVRDLVRDLNVLYRHTPALWQRDTDPAGFRWVACHSADDNVFAFLRYDGDGTPLLAVSNFSPVVRHDYRLRVADDVPAWLEVLNTDAARYGGGGVTNPDPVKPQDGSIGLTLPPLATVWLMPYPV